ncbi:MAG: hypothetical protein HC933_06420 [Pleurocapsa sp. SU_196_0]|nr:hypothetical protein [Pleurocapsa sp. SU_196_0]
MKRTANQSVPQALSPILVTFDDTLELRFQPDSRHEWLLTTEQVAEGYGVSVKTIRGHKISHADELVLDKHFLVARNTSSENFSRLVWTKRGVVRLGFFIRSERAKRFRDFCEDLAIQALEPIPQPTRKPSKPAPLPKLPHSVSLRFWQMLRDCYAEACQLTLHDAPELEAHLRELITRWHGSANATLPFGDMRSLFLAEFNLRDLKELEIDRFESALKYLHTRIAQAERVQP